MKSFTKKKVFTKKNYMSGDGMLTSVWGPSLWHFLHTMSFNYPIDPTNEEKQQYKSFILSLQHVLPCKYCRINLTNNFKHNPIEDCHMENRESFSRYIYKLHELINKLLKKKSKLKYCEVRERYEHFRSRCVNNEIKSNDKKQLLIFKKSKTKKEKGCTEPLYGEKAKCIINIVPYNKKCKTINIDKKCIKRRTVKID